METCVAPNCNAGKPADNMHCRFHAKQFNVLYKKYKKAQEPIDKYIDNPTLLAALDNVGLLRVVSVCNSVASIRKDYQVKALKPQFHDVGHEHFIRKLHEMSTATTKTLRSRFDVPSAIETAPTCFEVDEPETDGWVTSIVKPDVRKSVEEFIRREKELDEELSMLTKQKREKISFIWDTVMNVYNAVAPHLKTGPLDLTDRSCVLLCAVDIIESMYDRAIEELYKEEAIMGGLLSRGFDEFSRVIEYDEQGVPVIRHMIPKTHSVINWQHMPSDLDEAVEYIYQGRRPFMAIERIKPASIRATAALIDVARYQKDNFAYHFDIDMFADGTEEDSSCSLDDFTILVHVVELTGKYKTYYPRDLRKNK